MKINSFFWIFKKLLNNDNRPLYAQFEGVIGVLGRWHKCMCKENVIFF